MTIAEKITRLRVNTERLMSRIDELAQVGALDGGGVCRLALTDDDRRGRDLVKGWMQELRLEVSVDQIGNVIGIRRGRKDAPIRRDCNSQHRCGHLKLRNQLVGSDIPNPDRCAIC